MNPLQLPVTVLSQSPCHVEATENEELLKRAPRSQDPHSVRLQRILAHRGWGPLLCSE